jgi:hypothetical protein
VDARDKPGHDELNNCARSTAPSRRLFQKIRDRIAAWRQAFQLQHGAGVAAVIGAVQADVLVVGYLL